MVKLKESIDECLAQCLHTLNRNSTRSLDSGRLAHLSHVQIRSKLSLSKTPEFILQNVWHSAISALQA